MRFTVSSSDLNNYLQTLAKVIASKNVYEILESFLFKVGGGKITITASDGENTMTAVLAIEDETVAGDFAVPSQKLLEAMRELPEQPMTFDVNLEDNTVKILYQNGVYNLVSADAKEYPKALPMTDGATVITLTAEMLAKNLSRSVYAATKDEVRPVMSGVYFDFSTDSLSIVASDGHKLVRNRDYSVKTEVPTTFILPKKPANLLKAVLEKDPGDVVITFDTQRAVFTYGDGTLYCRLIEGKYPNYNSIIPRNNPNELIMDRKLLLSALRRTTPFAAESNMLVRFGIEPGTLTLRSEDTDFSRSAIEKLSCNYNGVAMNIGFKGGSFIDILSNIDCDEVSIKMSDPIRAAVITPMTQPENEELIVLIMPILLND